MISIINATQAKQNWGKFDLDLGKAERTRLKIRMNLPNFAAIIDNSLRGGGDPPAWPGARTLADMEAIAASNIKRLRRFRALFPGAEDLAEYLGTCRLHYRCFSGACVVCGWVFQDWAANAISRFTREQRDAPKPRRTTTIAVSVVPNRGFVQRGELQHLDMGVILTRVVAKMDATGLVVWGALGLDVGINDFTARGMPSGFQVQAYGFVETTNGRKLGRLLKVIFPSTPVVVRPVHTRRYDGSIKGASYALKPQFVRRISYLDNTGRWNTRKVSLRAPEHVELMLALDHLGLHRRLEVIGLRPFQSDHHVGLDWDLA